MATKEVAASSEPEVKTGPRISRLINLIGKGWSYLLLALEQPLQVPYLPLLQLRGVHIGEFLKLNRSWIKQAGIKTVIDVGAHAGGFSSAVRTVFPGARIYAFEPLPECCDEVRRKLGHGPFQVFQVAVGDQSGQVDFWRSSFTKSSSVLPMAQLHREAFPWSANHERLTVPLARLDDYVDELELEPKVLLKIDVQGYEDRVLRGAVRFLKRVDWIVVEVSFRRLYEGQGQFSDVYDFLVRQGFSYSGNVEQLLSPLDGSILQADALFVRSPVQ